MSHILDLRLLDGLPGVLGGGLVFINKKLGHKSVPVQLEKEAVVTVEASAQRSRCRCRCCPQPGPSPHTIPAQK
ncbi:hypothetical protein EYF80_019914 [Liparis tanakae]|uniref:Uncharacterized protein n=1 Tax=Liparis tanakae TaxID=230148 RepID=A0A4Z2HVH4_9TELE|nr:hypothetical protein EYF80_019914 [Liparis tanakae]